MAKAFDASHVSTHVSVVIPLSTLGEIVRVQQSEGHVSRNATIKALIDRGITASRNTSGDGDRGGA